MKYFVEDNFKLLNESRYAMEGLLNCTRYKKLVLIISKKMEREKDTFDGNRYWWILLHSTDSNLRRKEAGERLKWQIACIERLVINDGTYGNQVPGYQISETIFYWRDVVMVFKSFSNCWERELSLRLKRCLVDMDRSGAVCRNDLYRAVNKKCARRGANREEKRSIIKS